MKFRVGQDYSLLREIGKGAFGEVVLAQHKRSKAIVAIKKIEEFFLIPEDAKRQLREVLIHRHLSHCPGVPPLLDIIEPADRSKFTDVYLVFEAMPTDLRKAFKAGIHLTEY